MKTHVFGFLCKKDSTVLDNAIAFRSAFANAANRVSACLREQV